MTDEFGAVRYLTSLCSKNIHYISRLVKRGSCHITKYLHIPLLWPAKSRRIETFIGKSKSLGTERGGRFTNRLTNSIYKLNQRTDGERERRCVFIPISSLYECICIRRRFGQIIKKGTSSSPLLLHRHAGHWAADMTLIPGVLTERIHVVWFALPYSKPLFYNQCKSDTVKDTTGLN